MRQPIRLTVAAVVGFATLTGCSHSSATTDNGISKLDGRTILNEAYAQAKAAQSVHISGTGQCPNSAFIVDMRLSSQGYATGSITFPPDKLNVMATPTALYINAPKSFWVANTSAKGAAQIGTKWVRSENPNDSLCVRALASLSDVLANFVQLPGSVTKQGKGIVLGKQAVVLSLANATVFVTTTGPVLPIRVDSADQVQAGGSQDGISFGEWGMTVAPTLPLASDTIDAKQVSLK